MPRAIAPVLGAVLLVGVTVLLAVVVTVAASGFALTEPAEPMVVEVEATADSGRITLEPVSGSDLDVRELSLRVEVDDEPLVHQPPVPFFGATGFDGSPSGPFNPSTDPMWSIGEPASVKVAGTNHPELSSGATLVVTISRDDRLLARASTTVR